MTKSFKYPVWSNERNRNAHRTSQVGWGEHTGGMTDWSGLHEIPFDRRGGRLTRKAAVREVSSFLEGGVKIGMTQCKPAPILRRLWTSQKGRKMRRFLNLATSLGDEAFEAGREKRMLTFVRCPLRSKMRVSNAIQFSSS